MGAYDSYTPVSLGDVLAQAANIKGAQQKQQLGQLAIQQQTTDLNNQQGIQSTLASNPNASVTDLQKFGPAGVQASQQLSAAHLSDLTNHFRTQYQAASAVADSDNPAQTAAQVAPQFAQQYDQVHGPGAWEQLASNPAALKAAAGQVRDQALAGLVDPTEQYKAHAQAAEDHYKQQGPGGEADRNAATIAGANAREQFTQGQENSRNARTVSSENQRAGLNPDGSSPFGNASKSGLGGQAFLDSLPTNQAAQVKALAEGRMQFPGGQGLKSPYWQNMLSAVSQYDPQFDAANYKARSQTRDSFTSGKDAANITSLNTAIGHAGTLASQADGTFSTPVTSANYVLNAANQHLLGSAGPTNYKQTASALASELTTVFRGQGGAEGDVVRNLQSLDEDASAAQKKAALSNAVELLNSRLNALGEKYNQGMGTTSDPLTLLNPHAAATLQQLRGAGSAPVQTTVPSRNGAPTSQTPAANSVPTATGPGGQKLMLQNGAWVPVK